NSALICFILSGLNVGELVIFPNRVNLILFFFFQAEDGIRDFHVTGVQTCALPISGPLTVADVDHPRAVPPWQGAALVEADDLQQIGRASCRERVERSVGAVTAKHKKIDDCLIRIWKKLSYLQTWTTGHTDYE